MRQRGQFRQLGLPRQHSISGERGLEQGIVPKRWFECVERRRHIGRGRQCGNRFRRIKCRPADVQVAAQLAGVYATLLQIGGEPCGGDAQCDIEACDVASRHRSLAVELRGELLQPRTVIVRQKQAALVDELQLPDQRPAGRRQAVLPIPEGCIRLPGVESFQWFAPTIQVPKWDGGRNPAIENGADRGFGRRLCSTVDRCACIDSTASAKLAITDYSARWIDRRYSTRRSTISVACRWAASSSGSSPKNS